MSDLPAGVSESYFFRHPDGRQVELLNYRRKPEMGEFYLVKSKRSRRPGSFKSKKFGLLERDGNLCHYCEIVMKPSGVEFNSVSVEHIVAVSHGGPNSYDNLVLACRRCNNGLGSQVKKCNCVRCASALLKYGSHLL